MSEREPRTERESPREPEGAAPLDPPREVEVPAAGEASSEEEFTTAQVEPSTDATWSEPSVEDPAAQPGPEPRGSRIHPLAIFLAGLVIGLFIGYSGRPSTTAPQATRTPVLPGQARSASGAPTLMDTLIAQTRHFKGDPNAPVVIIEFSDFQ